MIKNNNVPDLESLIKSGVFDKNEMYQLKVIWGLSLIVAWLFFVICWMTGTFSSTAYLWVGDHSQILGLFTNPKVAGLNFIGFVVVSGLAAASWWAHTYLRR